MSRIKVGARAKEEQIERSKKTPALQANKEQKKLHFL